MYWRDNCDNPDNANLTDSYKPDSIEKVKYIPQSYFEGLCNNCDSQVGLTKSIENVIFDHLENDIRKGATNFEKLINNVKNKNLKRIDSFISSLNIAISSYVELTDSLLNERKKLNQSNLQEYEKQKISIEQQIEKLVKNEIKQPKENTNDSEVDKLNADIDKNETVKNEKEKALLKIYQNDEKINRIETELVSLKNYYNNFKDAILLDLNYLGIKETDIVRFEVNENILNEKKKVINSEIKSIKDEIKIIENEINNKKKEKEKIELTLSSEQKEYTLYQNRLKELKNKLFSILGDKENPLSQPNTYYYFEELCSENHIKSLEKEKEQKYKEIKKITRDIFQSYIDIKDFYNELKINVDNYIKKYNEDTGSDIKIDFIPKINIAYETFKNELSLHLNKKDKFYGERRDETFNKYKEYQFNEIADFEKFCDDIIDEIRTNNGNDEETIKFSLKNPDEQKTLYSYIYTGSYINVDYELKYEDKTVQMLSPGERGLLLLIFYLLADTSDRPLILDQPEDNLDNDTIFTKLVPLIRHAKKSRQVIIVTHNANLAINCDSEQIIWAQYSNKNKTKITYTSGSIENEEINKKLMDILEGTQPAFKNRERKYIYERG